MSIIDYCVCVCVCMCVCLCVWDLCDLCLSFRLIMLSNRFTVFRLRIKACSFTWRTRRDTADSWRTQPGHTHRCVCVCARVCHDEHRTV